MRRTVSTVGDAAARALTRDGYVAFRRAAADPRGPAAAQLCEQTEADRRDDQHWDQCRYVVIGYATLEAR